jgi:hypothetical protein
MRAKLFAAASVAALCAFAFSPAMAAPAAGGFIGGGYANTQFDHGLGHLDDWNLNGSASTPLGSSDFTLQGDGAYHSQHSSIFGTSHTDQLNLSVIWNAPMGKIGATVGRDGFGFGGPISISGTTYGGFGVLYPNHQWTVGLKGGSLEFGSGFGSAGYWGGEVVGYPTPNIALSLTGDQMHTPSGFFCPCSASNINSWSLGGEWQPTANPWSVSLGYENTKLYGINSNSWGLNFRYYFGGGSTLVDHHRNGAETWGTQQSALRFIF